MSGPSCEVPGKSAKQIFAIAEGIRRDLKIQSDSFPIVELLELIMPRAFPGFVFEVRDRSEMGNNHGLTIPKENAIVLRDDVYDGACEGKGRDRFTAAHELGHYLMHRDLPIQFHRAGTLAAYKDSEWQANTFAGALLMPRSGLMTCRSIDEVSVRFQVSPDAARVQLSKYGICI